MDRITRTDVERIADSITDGLQRNFEIFVQGRNGYTAIDLYQDGACVENLHLGTKREVYTYLQGMRRALLITNRL